MAKRRLVEGIVILPPHIRNGGRDLSYYTHKIIDKKIEVTRGDYSYVLCSPKKIQKVNVGTIHYAMMLKMSKSTIERYFNKEEWKPIEEERTEKHIRNYSRFLIYPDARIVLEDAYPHLSRFTFVDMYEQLLVEAIKEEEPIFQLQINFKKSTEEIHKFIERCSVIRAVKFTGLKAPNPYDFGAEKINRARDMIKRTNIKNIQFENPEGINVDADEISGTMGVVQSGIGDAKISGVVESGEIDTFETKDKLRSRRIEIADDKDYIKKAMDFVKKP